MQPIAQRLAEIARNIEIVGADPATRYGFTQVPNFMLTNKELSVGAKLESQLKIAARLATSDAFDSPTGLSRRVRKARATAFLLGLPPMSAPKWPTRSRVVATSSRPTPCRQPWTDAPSAVVPGLGRSGRGPPAPHTKV
jgi:hypothetical protein